MSTPSIRTTPSLGAERADNQAAQRALAGTGGADHPDALAGLDDEARRPHQHPLIDAKATPSSASRPRAGGKGSAAPPVRRLVEQVAQPLPALATGDQRAPAGEELLDGRQRPAEQDRGSDHAAACEFAFQHEKRAQAHHAYLDHEARGAGEPGNAAGALLRLLLQDEHLIVRAGEAGAAAPAGGP